MFDPDNKVARPAPSGTKVALETAPASDKADIAEADAAVVTNE